MGTVEDKPEIRGQTTYVVPRSFNLSLPAEPREIKHCPRRVTDPCRVRVQHPNASALQDQTLTFSCPVVSVCEWHSAPVPRDSHSPSLRPIRALLRRQKSLQRAAPRRWRRQTFGRAPVKTFSQLWCSTMESVLGCLFKDARYTFQTLHNKKASRSQKHEMVFCMICKRRASCTNLTQKFVTQLVSLC